MANALFVIDSVIIVAGAFYFGVDKAIYATAAVFVSSKVMDAILSGMTAKQTDLSYFKEMAGYSGGDHDIVKSRSDTDQKQRECIADRSALCCCVS